MTGQDHSRQLLTLLVRDMHPKNQPAVTEQVLYSLPAPPPHPDHREDAERRAQRASGNARHCYLSEICAARSKSHRRAARGNVDRTGDHGALGKTQRTPIDRNRAGNVGIVRHLDDSSEFVTDYFFDHFP